MSKSGKRRGDIVSKATRRSPAPVMTYVSGDHGDSQSGDMWQVRRGRVYHGIPIPTSQIKHTAEWAEDGSPRFTMHWADTSLHSPDQIERLSAEFRRVFDELAAEPDFLAEDLLATVRLQLIQDQALERMNKRGMSLAGATISQHLSTFVERYRLMDLAADLTQDQRARLEMDLAASLAEQVAEQGKRALADEESRGIDLDILSRQVVNNAAANAATHWDTGWSPSTHNSETYAAFLEVWRENGEALIVEHTEYAVYIRSGELGAKAASWALDDRERVVGTWKAALSDLRALELVTAVTVQAPIQLPSALHAPKPLRQHFRMPMNHLVSTVDEATRNAVSRKGWSDLGGTTAPQYVKTTRRERNVVSVSSRPDDGELHVPDEVRAQLWDGLKTLGDEAGDTFYALLIALTARGEDTLGEPAWLRPDEILDIRQVKRRRAKGDPSNWQHGHRSEDLLAVLRSLTALAGLWVSLDVETAPARGKKPGKTLSWEGRVIALTDTMGQRTLAGEIVPHRIRVVLGGWAERYHQAALRQVGLIAQKAFQYDARHSRAEKRLTGYFALQFRFNASGRARPLSCKVETLLERADIVRDAARPGETKKRLEKALSRLAADGVITGWTYPDGDPDLAARGWLEDWLALSVRVSPPPAVADEYTTIRKIPRPVPVAP